MDNVYAIKTSEGLILVDTGTDAREYEVIMENLAYWGLGTVTHVILTHAHINHCFNAKRFQDGGAKIICSRAVDEAISSASDRLIDYHNRELEYNVKTFPKCSADIIVENDGDFEIAGLHFDMNIINGHSKGGLLFFCMLEGRQIMFAGDFIHISPFNRHAIIGWEGDLEYDDAVYLEELKRFSTYEPDMILSGHHQLCMRDAWQIPKNAYVRACSSKHRSLNPNVPY